MHNPKVKSVTCVNQLPNKLAHSPTLSVETTINVVKGIIAVNIKKSQAITVSRIDFENDFLMCIEVFSSAIDAIPQNEDQTRILELNITNNADAIIFISACKFFGLTDDHEIAQLNLSSNDLFQELNKVLNRTVLINPIYSAGLVILVIMRDTDVFN
jgi:hypothetical protein